MAGETEYRRTLQLQLVVLLALSGRFAWRRASSVVLAGLLLAACATQQPLPPPERQSIPFGQGRIWQVDLPGLQPSYLFGTVHVNDPRVLELPEAAEAAFESAEIAAFEVGELPEPDDALKEQLFKLPEGESLSDLLGFWTYHRLTNLAAFRYFTLKDFDRLQVYLDGDLEMRYALWRRFLDHLDPDVAERFNERIGPDRNRIMAERLIPLFARGSTFVAVGAMHLPGEEGILRLLERQGFAVTRLQ